MGAVRPDPWYQAPSTRASTGIVPSLCRGCQRRRMFCLAARVFAEVRFRPPIRPLRTEVSRVEIMKGLYTKDLRMQIGYKHGFYGCISKFNLEGAWQFWWSLGLHVLGTNPVKGRDRKRFFKMSGCSPGSFVPTFQGGGSKSPE